MRIPKAQNQSKNGKIAEPNFCIDLAFSTKRILNRKTECYIFFGIIPVMSLVTKSSVWEKKKNQLDITEIHFRSD